MVPCVKSSFNEPEQLVLTCGTTFHAPPGYPGVLSSANPAGGAPWRHELQQTATPAKPPKIPVGTRLPDASQDKPTAKASMDQTGFDNSGLTQTAPPGRPAKPLGTSLDDVSAIQTPPPGRPAKPLGTSLDDMSITQTAPPGRRTHRHSPEL